MHQVTLKTLALLLFIAGLAVAQPRSEPRTFTGTWTCLDCDLAGRDGSSRTQCEQLGHRHCLRLNSGNYIFFLDNGHAKALITGGGRHDVKMSIKGTYYPNARTIDVQSYTIDGVTTAWNDEHQQMEVVSRPSEKRADTEDGQ